MILRTNPGARIHFIPGIGVKVIAPKGGAAAVTGWWLAGGIDPANCVAAYQAKGAASYAASKVNLTGNAAYDLTEGVAPGFDTALGWLFTGTQYLVTGIDASSFTNGVITVIVQFADAGTSGDRYLCGTDRLNLAATFNGSDNVRYRVMGSVLVAPRLVTGNLCVAGGQGYRDGVADGSSFVTATPYKQTIYIGATDIGKPYGMVIAKIRAFAIYNVVNSAPQVAALAAAMAAL